MSIRQVWILKPCPARIILEDCKDRQMGCRITLKEGGVLDFLGGSIEFYLILVRGITPDGLAEEVPIFKIKSVEMFEYVELAPKVHTVRLCP